MVTNVLVTEAAKTIVGTGAAYVLGKFLGRKQAKKEEQLRMKMCNLLWKLEFEVSPRLLPDVIRSEVELGCIKPEESDDRLKKVMEIREKYGLLGGANVYLAPSGQVLVGDKAKVPVDPDRVVHIEELQAKAMREVGPPSNDTELKTQKES